MSDHRRRDDLLELARRHPRRTFSLLTALIVAAIAGTVVVRVVDKPTDPVLPIEFRLVHPELSGLPVQIDRIRSCSCWHGPRDQAQRRYKFRLVNRTDHQINIDGGANSVIRLIVAYPNRRQPRITMPAHSGNEVSRSLPSPNNVDIPITQETVTAKPTRIPGSNHFFGVPRGYSVWALPATPNKLAELWKISQYTEVDGQVFAGGEVSYPTFVDRTHLLPGEEYEGDRLGHGTWTFYVPIPHGIAKQLQGNGRVEPVYSRGYYESFVIFVGIAALTPGPPGEGKLLGFGPAPSENAFAEPNDL